MASQRKLRTALLQALFAKPYSHLSRPAMVKVIIIWWTALGNGCVPKLLSCKNWWMPDMVPAAYWSSPYCKKSRLNVIASVQTKKPLTWTKPASLLQWHRIKMNEWRRASLIGTNRCRHTGTAIPFLSRYRCGTNFRQSAVVLPRANSSPVDSLVDTSTPADKTYRQLTSFTRLVDAIVKCCIRCMAAHACAAQQ